MNQKVNRNDDLFSRLVRYAIAAGLIVLAYFIRNSLAAVLTPVIIAVILTYLLTPLVNLLTRKLKFKKWLAILCAMLVLLLIIAAVFAFFIPAAIKGVNRIIGTLPGIVESLGDKLTQIQNTLEGLGIPNNLGDSMKTLLSQLTGSLEQSLSGAFSIMANTVSILSSVLIALYFTVFFLKDKKLLVNDIFRLVPRKHRDDVRKAAHNIKASLRNFLRAQFIIAVISLVATTLGYLLIGLNYAVPLGIIMGVFCLVPYVGPIIGAVPALLIGLLQPDVIIYIILVILVVQGAVGVLGPKIMGAGLGIHPVYILMGIIFFAALLGVVGMLFALPILIVIHEIVHYILWKRDFAASEEDESMA